MACFFMLSPDFADRYRKYLTSLPCAQLLLCTLALTACTLNNETNSLQDSHDQTLYELVWADEFDQETCPSPHSWIHEEAFVRNRELQWFQPDNAFCKDSILIIEARREKKTNPNFFAQSSHWQQNRRFIEYTSASLMTRGLWNWRYGRFEMRARIPVAPGLWPVFWTMGSRGQWPACGEIDIMESYRGLLLANACWAGDEQGHPDWNISRHPVTDLGDKWAESFHIWRLEWTEADLRLFVDDRLLNTVDLQTTLNPPGTVPPNPFQQPHFLILTLAVGGSNGGNPSSTVFPARFEVDYIRVYQELGMSP